VWNLESGEELRTLEGHTHWVDAVAVTPDGQRAVSASGSLGHDKTLRVWDLQSGKELHTLEGHTISVKAVVVTPDGRRAVSQGYKTLRVWDLESGAETALLTVDGRIQSCAVAPDGLNFVAGTVKGKVNFLRLENVTPGAPVVTAQRHRSRRLWVRCPLCRGSFEIEDSDLGNVSPCPDCGAALQVNPFTWTCRKHVWSPRSQPAKR
jgi:WD40 repeat protein